MRGHREQRTPWFGDILTWTRTNDGNRQTVHEGTTHELIALTAHEAAQVGTKRGWHFRHHPDLTAEERDTPAARPVGPRLGTTIDYARCMAEAWLLVGPDRGPTDTTPGFMLVLNNAGARLPLPDGAPVPAVTLHTSRHENRIHAEHPTDPGRAHLGVLVPRFTGTRVGFLVGIGDNPPRTRLADRPLPWRDAATLLARGLADLLTEQERAS